MLTRVTGRVDCFGCVYVLQNQRYSVFYNRCVLMFTFYTVHVCSFPGIFYAVLRQIYVIHRQ